MISRLESPSRSGGRRSPSSGIRAHPRDHGQVRGAVGRPIAPRFRRCRWVSPEEARSGATPQHGEPGLAPHAPGVVARGHQELPRDLHSDAGSRSELRVREPIRGWTAGGPRSGLHLRGGLVGTAVGPGGSICEGSQAACREAEEPAAHGPAVHPVAAGDVGDRWPRVEGLSHGQERCSTTESSTSMPGSSLARLSPSEDQRGARDRTFGGTQVPEPLWPRNRSRVGKRDTGAEALFLMAMVRVSHCSTGYSRRDLR